MLCIKFVFILCIVKQCNYRECLKTSFWPNKYHLRKVHITDIIYSLSIDNYIFIGSNQLIRITLEFFIIEKHISLIQRERLSTMRLVNCSSENNTHSRRKTVTYIYDMRPTIHSQEYPIKFNLKLPFQLRKKEEEQRRLKSV